MKKILLVILLLCTVKVASAQDTVTFEDDFYLIKGKEESKGWNTDDTGTYFTIDYFYLSKAVADFPIEESTTVYGIAITMDTSAMPYLCPPPVQYNLFTDTNRYIQVKLMRENGKDSLNTYSIVDSISFDSHGMPPLIKKSFFQYTVDTTYHDFLRTNTEGLNPVRTCYELFFDSPHLMSNDFYLGFIDSITSDSCLTIDEYYSFFYQPRFYKSYSIKKNNGPYPPTLYKYFNEAEIICFLYWDESLYQRFEKISWDEAVNDEKIAFVGALQAVYPWGMIFPIVKLRCRGGVKGIDLYDKGKGYARVVWNFNEWDNLNRYEVRLDTVNTLTGDTVEVYHGFVDDTLALFTNLAEGQAYRCSVRKGCRYATSSYDTTLWSNTWQHVEFATDIYGISQPDGTDFSLSPNPASGTARLTLPRPIDEDATVVLRDLCGRTLATAVLPRGATELAIPLDGLAPSAYLVQLTTPTALSTRRLVVR